MILFLCVHVQLLRLFIPTHGIRSVWTFEVQQCVRRVPSLNDPSIWCENCNLYCSAADHFAYFFWCRTSFAIRHPTAFLLLPTHFFASLSESLPFVAFAVAYGRFNSNAVVCYHCHAHTNTNTQRLVVTWEQTNYGKTFCRSHDTKHNKFQWTTLPQRLSVNRHVFFIG